MRRALGAATLACCMSGAMHAQEPPPAAPETALDEAEDLLRAGRAVDAAAAFTKVLETSPGVERAVAGRLEAWIDADRLALALAELDRLGEAAVERSTLAGAIGAVIYRSGRIPEAGALLDRHARSEGFTARGASVLGAVRLAEGRGEEAVAWMSRALAADPNDARILLRAAEAAPSRRDTAERLARYLEIGGADDADRREGARGTLAWLEALGEREIWRAGTRPDHVEQPLVPLRDARGNVVAHGVTTRLGTKRRSARILLDSGSGGLFVEERIARKAGLEPLADETTFGGGGSGRHRSIRGVVPIVAIGELSFLDGLVTASPVEIDPLRRYVGVIGLGVFDGYRVTIDLRDGRLVLDRGEPALASGEPYWVVAGQILVRAAARGGPPGLFLLDTGATSSVVGSDYLARLPGARIVEGTAARGYGGAVPGARWVENVEIELLGHTTRGRALLTADLHSRSRLGGVEIAGYLGMDLLGDRVLTLDSRSRRVEFEGPED